MNYSVDIIIPTFRRSEYLVRAINSALNQTYKDIRVIVVDDNSEGDEFRITTRERMQSFENNEQVVYLCHEKNRNGAAARNTGIKYSDAEYIAFLDDDDLFMPQKIERQVKLLCASENKDKSAVACFHVRRYHQYTYKAVSINERVDGNYFYDFMIGKTSMPSSTLLFRSAALKSINGFDESFNRHQDWELLGRFFRKHKLAISPSFDTYMQVEGFRNYPNGEKSYKIKEQFLSKFETDIIALPDEKQKEIIKYQWLEVVSYFLREFKISQALEVIRNKISKTANLNFKDYLKMIFYIIWGKFAFSKVILAVVLSSTKYKKIKSPPVNID